MASLLSPGMCLYKNLHCLKKKRSKLLFLIQSMSSRALVVLVMVAISVRNVVDVDAPLVLDAMEVAIKLEKKEHAVIIAMAKVTSAVVLVMETE